jgi:MFS family permease
LTSVTGFMFPLKAIGPPHIVGAISLGVLVLALVALYARGLAGNWRWIYIVTAILALYLNVFVAVVQAFQKLEPFRQLAPTQTEPPFAIAQLLVLALFIAFGVLSVKRFHPATLRHAT